MFAVCSKNFTQGNITEFNKHWISGHDKKDPFQFQNCSTSWKYYYVVYDLIKSIFVITNLSIQTKVGVGKVPRKRPHFNVLYEF